MASSLEVLDNLLVQYRLKQLMVTYDVDKRRELFCRCARSLDETNVQHRRFYMDIMSDESLFPGVEDASYFLQYAVKNYSYKLIRLLEAARLNVHEMVVDRRGYSALHYLAEVDGTRERNHYFDDALGLNVTSPGETMRLARFLVRRSDENYSDEHGYSYLHGACMVGDADGVLRFIARGADVNLDTWKRSPLHVAARYRRRDVVRILLDHGADPDRRDDERSTPLHALARTCLCECGTGYSFCDRKRPVDKIVEALAKRGADREARNRHGDSPLQLAVARFDVELVESLLEHGASLAGLNEYRMFEWNFTPLELKNYPLSLNVIEVMGLLQSAGYRLSYWARRRMLKCWVKIRGNDTDHLISYVPEGKFRDSSLDFIVNQLIIHERFGFYMKRETADHLQRQIHKMKQKLFYGYVEYKPSRQLMDRWELQVATLNGIMLNDSVSLYELCRLNHAEGHAILKGMKNWRVPALRNLPHLRTIVKRHLANILIRPYLELAMADIFTWDSACRLDLPYAVCRQVVEYMSDEELFRLREQVDDGRAGFLDTLRKFRRLICNLFPRLGTVD